MAVDALPLETSLVLERTTAAVRITIRISSLSIISSTHSHGLPFLVTAAGYTCPSNGGSQCILGSTNTNTNTNTITKKPTPTFTTPKPTNTLTGSGGDNNGDSGNDSNGNSSDDNSSNDNSSNGDSSNDSGSGGNGSNGSNGIKTTSSSSRSSPSPTSFLPSSQSSGAKDWKASSTFFGLAPFLVLISAYIL